MPLQLFPANASLASTGRTSSNFWSRFSARHASSNSRLITYAIHHNFRVQEKGPAAVAVTSPTGLSHSLGRRPLSLTTSFAGAAAVSIDGVTLHSFAGCGVPSTADFGKMFGKENVAKWKQLQVLVVDEISMVQVFAVICCLFSQANLNSNQAQFIDWLDVNVRRIRNKQDCPFGGVQLVFAGGNHTHKVAAASFLSPDTSSRFLPASWRQWQVQHHSPLSTASYAIITLQHRKVYSCQLRRVLIHGFHCSSLARGQLHLR